MTDNECRINFILSKIFIPGSEYDKYTIDIISNGENYRVKYPMTDSLTIPLKNIFTNDRNTIGIIIMTQEGQKYRKLAKGEINIYKKYFLSEKLEVEKFIHLDLCKPQLDKNKFGSNILNAMSAMGKIYFKALLIDPELNESRLNQNQETKSIINKTSNLKNSQVLKNNIKMYLTNRDKLSSNKTERFKSITNKEAELLLSLNKDPKNKSKKNKNDEDDSLEDVPLDEKLYSDGLSDISVSIIEGLEDDCVKIEEVNSEMNNFVNKIKTLFDEKFEQMLPTNNEELKLYVNKITKQIQLIAENYITNIEQLQDINNKIKQQAKIYYEKYKEKKKVFKKERKELKKKNQILENEINNNIEGNKQIKGKFDDFRGELSYFKSLIGIKEENKVDEDIIAMVDILNMIKNEIDITAGLDENQKLALDQVMTKYKDKIDDDKDLLSSSLIIDKIELVVNDLYQEGKIDNIEIKQNTEIEYEFNNHVVCLRLDKETLMVEKENLTLEKWLLKNFGIKKK